MGIIPQTPRRLPFPHSGEYVCRMPLELRLGMIGKSEDGLPKKRVTQNKNETRKGVKRALCSNHKQFPYILTKEFLDSTSTSLAWRTYRQSGSDTNAVRTPTQCHIDLACNTSYHFAASRTVSPRVSSYLFPGPFAPFGSRI